MFKNRYEAGAQLAEKLKMYKGQDGIVLAIPRGGVPLGYVIAKELGFPLEIILSKKIGHPKNPEYAIGSVSLDGVVMNDNITDVSMDYVQQQADKILASLKEKSKFYMGDRKFTELENKTVIIVDDGVATGSTIIASIQSIRKKNPKEIIIAVPVCPMGAVSKFRSIADAFICLSIPPVFYGVGQFYKDFSQVSDDEVIRLLKEANTHPKVI